MYAQGCTNIEDSRIRGRSGRAGGLDTGLGVGSTSSALAMSAQRPYLPTQLRIGTYDDSNRGMGHLACDSAKTV
jgi:hypothetical protein